MILHACATKEWLKAQLRRYGPEAVLEGGETLTLADALQMVDDCPTENIPLGDGCVNRDPVTGQCRGCPSKLT